MAVLTRKPATLPADEARFEYCFFLQKHPAFSHGEIRSLPVSPCPLSFDDLPLPSPRHDGWTAGRRRRGPGAWQGPSWLPDAGRTCGVSSQARTTTDLGEVVLLPGFINPHCHLDYSTLRHAILPPRSFSEWVGRINALKRTLDPEDYLAAIARGFRESARWGTTALLNIESFPELMWKMPPPPLRTWWFYEMIDVRSAIATEELVAGALLFFQETARDPAVGEWLGGRGLSPHAPYTASPELYQLARECARGQRPALDHPSGRIPGRTGDVRPWPGGRFTISSPELGRPMGDCGAGRSALAQLTARGCLGPECIAVHLNDWEEPDFALVAPGGPLAGLTVVHCPLSHRYFRHTAFPLETLQKLAVNLCVGTDSPRQRRLVQPAGGIARPGRRRPRARPGSGNVGHDHAEPRARVASGGEAGLRQTRGVGRPRSLSHGQRQTPRNIHAEVVGCRAPAAWLMVHGRVVFGLRVTL